MYVYLPMLIYNAHLYPPRFWLSIPIFVALRGEWAKELHGSSRCFASEWLGALSFPPSKHSNHQPRDPFLDKTRQRMTLSTFFKFCPGRGYNCADWGCEGRRGENRSRRYHTISKLLLCLLLHLLHVQSGFQSNLVEGRKSLDILVEELNTCRSQRWPQVS